MAEDLGYLKRVRAAGVIVNRIVKIPYHNWFVTSQSKGAKKANATGWLVTRIGINQFKCTCPDYQGRELIGGDEEKQARIWDSIPNFYPCKHIIAVCMVEQINYMKVILGEISANMVYNFNVISGKDPNDDPVEIKVNTNGQLEVAVVSGGGGDASEATLQEISNHIGDTAITGVTMPTGGVGLFGWLSAIWKRLVDGIITTKSAQLLLNTSLSSRDNSASLSTNTYEKVIFDYTINSINLSVELQVQTSIDNVNWEDALKFPKVVTQNGFGQIVIDRPSIFTRFQFVNEHSGTNAVVSVKATGY